MPAVLVRYDPTLAEGKEAAFRFFIGSLLSYVAEALDVPENPDGRLTSDDVEIYADPFGPFDRVGENRICIILIANDYAERVANLEERREQLQREISLHLGRDGHTGKGNVYITPIPGCFGEFAFDPDKERDLANIAESW